MQNRLDETSDKLLLREISDEVRILVIIIITLLSDEGFTPFDKPYAHVKRLLNFKNADALAVTKEHL